MIVRNLDIISSSDDQRWRFGHVSNSGEGWITRRNLRICIARKSSVIIVWNATIYIINAVVLESIVIDIDIQCTLDVEAIRQDGVIIHKSVVGYGYSVGVEIG